jgi:hypothetical protein
MAMIGHAQVMEVILEACPSFRATWDASDDKESPYVVMGEFARHLLELHVAHSESALLSAGSAIERLHSEGDSQVRELATIGILESIQNVWSHSGLNPDSFAGYLLPESLKWWRSLQRFWAGEIPYVGHDVPPSGA